MSGEKRVPNSTHKFTRSTMPKRDSLAAELERDPQLSRAKRQQQNQEFEAQISRASLERKLLAAQTDKAELDAKLIEKDAEIERLEQDRRWLAEREAEEREAKERERTERAEEKRNLDDELHTLRRTHTSLQEEHADLQETHAALSRSTSQALATQKSEIAILTAQVSVLSVELEHARGLANDREKRLNELQTQVDDMSMSQTSVLHTLPNEEGEREREKERESWAVVREELYRQANYLRTLENTNARQSAELHVLRAHHTSVEVLREEKRDMERKLQGLDKMRDQIVKLEAELEAGRREREEWASRSASEVPASPSHTPISVTQTLSSLRLAHAALLEQHGSLSATVQQRTLELSDAEQRLSEREEVIEGLQVENADTRDSERRMRGRLDLLEMEVGFLKALVASYTAELEAANLGGIAVDTAKVQRIQHLEEMLEEYKKVNGELLRETDALGGGEVAESGSGRGRSRKELLDVIAKERSAKSDLQKALDSALSNSQTHLAQIDTLEQALWDLKGEIGGGRHVPPGVRVLSLKENPVQEWVDLRQAAMDRLRSENEALLKRLSEVEKRGGGPMGGSTEAVGENEGKEAERMIEGAQTHGEDLVPRESYDVANREKQELEEMLKQKEKRLLRLKEVFTAKSAEFRDAIASILGLKLAFYPNGQVRVTSQYDLTASFVFQPVHTAGSKGKGNEDEKGQGRMQLIAQGEGGPREMEDLMAYWVNGEMCIPGFMASVTLECYDKWKRDQGR